jgi:hypothetical protein
MNRHLSRFWRLRTMYVFAVSSIVAGGIALAGAVITYAIDGGSSPSIDLSIEGGLPH